MFEYFEILNPLQENQPVIVQMMYLRLSLQRRGNWLGVNNKNYKWPWKYKRIFLKFKMKGMYQIDQAQKWISHLSQCTNRFSVFYNIFCLELSAKWISEIRKKFIVKVMRSDFVLGGWRETKIQIQKGMVQHYHKNEKYYFHNAPNGFLFSAIYILPWIIF